MTCVISPSRRVTSRWHDGLARFAWLSVVGLVGCGSSSSTLDPGDKSVDAAANVTAIPDGFGSPEATDSIDAAPLDDDGPGSGSCLAEQEARPIEGASHVATCTKVSYRTNPPSSGDHYGIWAAYQTYTQPIPVGFWVHSLEHGAVVISYNCPEGCAAEVAAAQAVIDAAPADCGAGQKRIILVPYPDLDVRFAASAWGYTLRSTCFDRATFAAFIAAHYGHGPEDICGGGQDPTGGPGGTPICATQ